MGNRGLLSGGVHPRLINQLLENLDFAVEGESLGYVVRDIVNMNWWNTCGVLTGYSKNRRVQRPIPDRLKLIAVQLKEFYRQRTLAIKDEYSLKNELTAYVAGTSSALPQLSAWSMPTRANPSQYFFKNGAMTWVDCTSRATYAAKYVCQNGYIDFDGVCRVLGASRIVEFILDGRCEDIGVTDAFIDGANQVKAEAFGQKKAQRTVADWVDALGIVVIPERAWLYDAIRDVRTDPYKIYEASRIAAGTARGVNECLYGYKTSASKGSDGDGASSRGGVVNQSPPNSLSSASNASAASDASTASAASDASRASAASDASHASAASDASHASRASKASNVSHASDASAAGSTAFDGSAWSECQAAIKKPIGLDYPAVFHKNIFAIAGFWKINHELVLASKLGWFDPFMGHGLSPLFAKRYGVNYVGFDTNCAAFDAYLHYVQTAIATGYGSSVEIRCKDSTVFQPDLVGKFDLVYTSPPYFDFEEYGGNTGHLAGCATYADFHEKITIPVFRNAHEYLIQGGILALQTEKNAQLKKLWIDAISRVGGFELIQDKFQGMQSAYSQMAKRDQTLLIFQRIEARH